MLLREASAVENCVNIINRASRKRSFPIATVLNADHHNFKQTTTKKRVGLGDLTNSGRVCSSRSSDTRHLKQAKNKCVEGEHEKSDVCVCFQPVHSNRFLYAPLIYQNLHLLEIEEKRRPLPNYMEKIQKDVTVGMCEILVDWLVEVADEYKLSSDTLFLTVSYIDRFLSSHYLSRNKLQHVYSLVVQMEKDLLNFLELELNNPTPKTFLRIFIRATQGDTMSSCSSLEFLSCLLVELSLLDYSCLRFLPSME